MRIQVRTLATGDEPFVYSTYLRNRWFSKDNTTTLKRSTWSALQHNRLERIFAEDTVLIACLDDDPDIILGYVFVDDNNPFCYIKLAFRSETFKVKNKLMEALNGNKT